MCRHKRRSGTKRGFSAPKHGWAAVLNSTCSAGMFHLVQPQRYLLMAEDFRIEKDSMGEMRIPARYLFGATTQRAVENFPISGIRFNRDFIRMLAVLKATCAEVNRSLG